MPYSLWRGHSPPTCSKAAARTPPRHRAWWTRVKLLLHSQHNPELRPPTEGPGTWDTHTEHIVIWAELHLYRHSEISRYFTWQNYINSERKNPLCINDKRCFIFLLRLWISFENVLYIVRYLVSQYSPYRNIMIISDREMNIVIMSYRGVSGDSLPLTLCLQLSLRKGI